VLGVWFLEQERVVVLVVVVVAVMEPVMKMSVSVQGSVFLGLVVEVEAERYVRRMSGRGVSAAVAVFAVVLGFLN